MTLFCAIPSCRLRGRHTPACPGTEACDGCLPRIADSGYTCDRCDGRAQGSLDAITHLAPDARLVAAGLARIGGGHGSGKPASRPPLNPDATDTVHVVQNRLTTLAQDIAETRGLTVPDAGARDPIVVAARWLQSQLDWMRHATLDNGEPYAIGAYAEIGECARRLRSVINGPSEMRYLGPCGTRWIPDPVDDEFGTEVECDGDVYGRPGADKGACRTCETEYDQHERRAWLDGEVRQHTYTIKEIADAYGINVKTIRSWRDRGRLTEHGQGFYNLGEVLDLAAADAARRESARAGRERRAAAREAARDGSMNR